MYRGFIAIAVGSILIAVLLIAGAYIVLQNFISYSNTPASTLVAENWAGYVVATDLTNPGPNVAGVNGSWVVPSVSDIGVDAFSAVWVGIGGQFEKSLVQIGTEQDFTGGVASYSAWYETLPTEAITIDSITVSPGDRMQASVVLVDASNYVWLLSLSDLSTGKSFQITLTYPSGQTSAEWIVERPDINNAISTLANFGTVTFSGCQASISSTGNITSFANAKILMMGGSSSSGSQSVQLADVSDLSSDGRGFTVNYLKR